MLYIITSYPIYHLLLSLLIVFLFIGFELKIVNFRFSIFFFILTLEKVTCRLFCLKDINIMCKLFKLMLQMLVLI